jgi:Ubiquitin carboxyl-terminal hydrolase
MIKTKLSEKVLLPLHLDLRAVKNEDPTMIAERRYTLCAVMRHKGTSAYSGHYVAEAMDWLSGQWYEFNDQNVEHLTDGPSCSYDPSLIEFENHSTTKNDTDVPSKISFSGSQDAYNMYYVEESFLEKCIRDSLEKEMLKGDLSSQSGDIVSSMAAERSQFYENLRQ